MNRRVIIASALAAAIAAPSALYAQDPTPTPTFKADKCYGLAKTGNNVCASTGNHSCSGTSRVDVDPRALIYMPTGYCGRIVSGSLNPKA